jgi:Rab proteins geranylgeranyltransferase component A
MFQVIVIGTGLEESIVAAAAARNGHTVLHIDSNDFYGGQWAAFTLDGIQKWVETVATKDSECNDNQDESLTSFLSEGETLVKAGKLQPAFQNVKQNWSECHKYFFVVPDGMAK